MLYYDKKEVILQAVPSLMVSLILSSDGVTATLKTVFCHNLERALSPR